ncbi:MAG: glutamate cyclase domain-containing protein, partial [Dehalococcoidia bacterium]
MDHAIEDLILGQDQRGVSELRHLLPEDFCDQAAQFILEHPGNVAIVTGFHILSADQHETDGPPGAIAIGDALQYLGRQVSYVTDSHSTSLMRDWLGDRAEVLDFPISDLETSVQVAQD